MGELLAAVALLFVGFGCGFLLGYRNGERTALRETLKILARIQRRLNGESAWVTY